MIRSEITRKTAIKPSTKRMKASRPKMTEARKAAQDKPCLVRIPGACNGNPETTVLAHYRLAGYCGTGIKPPDGMAARACSGCHDCIDGRTPPPDGWTKADVRLAHAEGVMRTREAEFNEGLAPFTKRIEG